MHEVTHKHAATERATKSRGRLVSPDLSGNSRGKNMIDICCVASGVKYHSLSYWSIVMTSILEYLTGEFCAKQVRKVL